MKKYFAAALTLLGAVALMLAGMYVYSQPDSGGDETLVTKNIIVGSVEVESRGGDSFYVLRDKFGSEYIFNRLPERMRSESYEGRNAQVRCTPADSSGRRLLRELSIDGKVLISDALAALYHCVDIEQAANPEMLDFNGDGKDTIADALAMLRYSVGLSY